MWEETRLYMLYVSRRIVIENMLENNIKEHKKIILCFKYLDIV